MDFNDSPEEAAFRAKARAWLEANAPKVDQRGEDAAGLLAAKAWQAKKADAGYACLTWPKDWGGAGEPPIMSVIFSEEESRLMKLGDPFVIGLGMCVPTVMSVGDETAKQRFAAPAIRGDEIWCQLFSEPGGGSDVAGVRTRAVQGADGDWTINGQKVWTTGAHFADFGLVICRTNPDVPKHKGLTMFWLDMKSPGVEVRPIHQMAGGSGFNEVFFTDVRIPDSQRLGAVGDGWRVSLVTLMNERLAVSGGFGLTWAQFMDTAREIPAADGRTALANAAIREKLADWYVRAEGLKHIRNRTVTALSRGETPGPESSIGKLVAASQTQDLASEAVEMLDQYGIIDDPALAARAGGFHASFLASPGGRIAGGTDEIMRNIIAERVLGLPGDIRLDKDVAFKDIPTGR